MTAEEPVSRIKKQATIGYLFHGLTAAAYARLGRGSRPVAPTSAAHDQPFVVSVDQKSCGSVPPTGAG